MKPAIKEKWLKALRSGEYKKARGVLHNPITGGHCCLGVLDIQTCLGGTGGLLNDEQLKHVGMTDIEQNALTRLNDKTAGWGAACRYIEKNL